MIQHPQYRSISDQIRAAVKKAMTNGLVRPTALYLGRQEYAALRRYCKQATWRSISVKPIGCVIEFDGMRVCRVMESSHLGVA
jgi:hypothetical protein